MQFPFYTGGKLAALSDTTKETRGFQAFTVGVAGTVTLLSTDGSVVLVNCIPGWVYPVSGYRVNVTGTSATGISLLW